MVMELMNEGNLFRCSSCNISSDDGGRSRSAFSLPCIFHIFVPEPGSYIGKKEKPIEWEDRWNFARDISSAISFLHSCKPPIVHRDLKSPNVLVSFFFLPFVSSSPPNPIR